MCGIAGYLHFKKPIEDSSIIRSMTNRMKHRGPDADGFHIDRNIALGHRRLSIIDLSEKANQPIFDATGRYCIVFNGEIYNYAELKSLLPNYPFATNGDTEVVLAAYIQWGVSALARLKGMFAFAIWDAQNKELFITRDRLGVKPLYYYQDDNQFLFSSEIRSILQSGAPAKEIDRVALIDYFSYQSFQTPLTVVKGVRELPAGYWLKLSNTTLHLEPYWSVEHWTGDVVSENQGTVEKKIYNLLLQSVERRMVADVPVAAFLSGGIDSSVVVGLMTKISQAPETFNIAFDEKDFDESPYAKIISKKFNTRHHELFIKPEAFLSELPAALNALDTPSGDGVNTYVISKAIRQAGIKVALSGVGGDELFAGYPIFQAWQKLNRLRKLWLLPSSLRSLIATVFSGENIKKQRMAQLLKLPSCTIAEAYPILRQVNSDQTIRKLLNLPFSGTQLKASLLSKQGAIEKFPLHSQVSISEYIGYTQHTLLKDTDQMSMANSLEVREPFFDHELIEYVLRIPDNMKNGSNPKSLLLKATGDLLPPEIYQRPKKGFTFPWNHWLRNELRSYSEQRIKNLAQRDFMNEKSTLHYWNDFLNQKNGIGYSHILLLVALENYIEQNNLS